MTRARRAPRVAPAFDLFELAPAPALVVVPEPVPEPPAWAVEATRPTPVTERARDFAARVERIWHSDGRRFVERTYASGTHDYYAWERADCFGYECTADELTYGRIDTRRLTRSFDPVTEVTKLREWEAACWAEARDLIHELCIETVHVIDDRGHRETGPGHAVYDGAGRVCLLSRPETRYHAAIARRRPA